MTSGTVEYTTTRLSKETWARLNAMRQVPSESIEDVVRRLLERVSAKAPPK